MNNIRPPAVLETNTGTAAYFSKLVWIVLFVGLVISLVAWQIAMQYEQRVATAVFEVESKEQSLLIRKELETASSALEDLASMYAVNDVISGAQFERFVSPILARNQALKALSWNPVITHADRDAHESALQEDGLTDYRITQPSADGTIETAYPREHYIVVSAIEPLENNRSARGYDVASEITRREALERARDTASLAIAAPIVLDQSLQESRAALGFLPIYRAGMPVETLAERRANLRGYLVVVVDFPQLIAAALSSLTEPGIEQKIITTPPDAAPGLMYLSNGFTGGDGITPTTESDPPSRLTYSTGFSWGGHLLDLQFAASDPYRAAGKSWVPWGILLVLVTLTLLTAAMLRLLRGRTVAIARQVDARTRELQVSNRELQAEVVLRNEVEERLEEQQHQLEREVAARTSELKATTAQLRTILDSEPECVKIISADGALEDMNAAGLAMIEADSMEEVRGCDVYSLVDDEYRDAFIEMNQRVIGGQSETLEFKLRGLKGTERWVETHAVPLVDLDGANNRHLAITRDVTTKKANEEKQAMLEGQLRHAQKLESIGVMAGGIAHDFNNLLQVIIGNSELALGTPGLHDSAHNAIKAGQSAAIDAAKLCDQMLTYAGQSRPAIQPIHLPDLVKSIINLLGVSHSKNSELEFVSDHIQGMIDGDDAQLRQVVMNLVTNASEAIGEQPGHIGVHISNVNIAADIADDRWLGAAPSAGRYVRLDVSDNGCGMDVQTQERMFDPFFTTKFAGRGLGLSATLGIIQSHNGYLKVDSTPNRGTRVIVLFPVSVAKKQAEPQVSKQPAVFSQTVLLVDDETAVREVGRAMLDKLGCRVVLAAQGEDALKYFADHADATDVVLLDLTMPGISGNVTCAELRRIRPDIPVIFCSGYASGAVQAAMDSPGYTGFLHKPFTLDALVRALEAALTTEGPTEVQPEAAANNG